MWHVQCTSIYMYVLSLSQDEEEEIILEVDVLRKVITMGMVLSPWQPLKHVH